MTFHIVRPVEGPIDAVVRVPGSKSIANRALACAAMCDGAVIVDGVPDGDDSEAMLECLQLLGVGASRDDAEPATLHVQGTGGRWAPGPTTLPARLAGTTSRFVTALAALGPGPYTVDGLPPLRQRPMAPLHDALVALGVSVQPGETWGHLPVTLAGRAATPPSPIEVPGDISSQYLTALMLIGPLLQGGLQIRLTSPLVSRPYVAMTAAVMEDFGVAGVAVGGSTITVPAGRYHVGGRVAVEPDASSASYPLAAAAVAGGAVSVPGLVAGSLQGDAAFADLLGRMGCAVERGEAATTVRRTGPLHGIDVDMSDVSDLVPTLAVVAAFADTPSRIRGVGFIRGKESDRIGDLAAELQQAGLDVRPEDDGLSISPSAASAHGARLATHHDHRLAMSFALVGLVVDGIEVADPDVVSKSWPSFWSMIDGLR